MNRFCSNCGKEIQAESSFCINCGNKLDVIHQNNFNNNSMSDQNQNNSNKNNGLKIASLVIGIISICLSFVFNLFIIPLAIVGLILGIVYSCKNKKFCIGIVLNSIGIILPIIITSLLVGIINSFYETTTNQIEEIWSDSENYNDNLDDEDDFYYDSNIYEDDSYFDDSIYDDNVDDNNEITNEDSVYFKEISFEDLSNKINNSDDFVLLISQSFCSYCSNFKPKLMNIANDYKIEIFYIEYDLLDDEQSNIFKNYVDFSGTPTTVFFENGSVNTETSRIEGDVSEEKIISILTDNGFIQ